VFDKVKKLSLGLAALAGAAAGGAAFASAATSHATAANAPAKGKCPAAMPAPGTAKHENAEKAVTGADAEKAQAAAVDAAGGGTAGDVTTDYIGKGYEVTVTQSDGSSVEYHLDGSFNVLPFPDGPPGGPGGPGGPGAPGGSH
jgi:hypothetical protein